MVADSKALAKEERVKLRERDEIKFVDCGFGRRPM